MYTLLRIVPRGTDRYRPNQRRVGLYLEFNKSVIMIMVMTTMMMMMMMNIEAAMFASAVQETTTVSAHGRATWARCMRVGHVYDYVEDARVASARYRLPTRRR